MLTSLVTAAFVFAATQISGVSAHGGVLSYNIGGVYYQGFRPYVTPVGQSSIQRQWATFDPITDPSSSILACNNPGDAPGTQLSATVAAGSKVVAYWNVPWAHNVGPVMTYMAKCPGSSCSGVAGSSLSWFKIDQAGLISGTYASGTWGQGQLIANNNSWTSTIPKSLAPGAYLFRNELLAIHTTNQPQFYPECAQLTVTGSGSASPPASYLVKFPGAYKASDPGVTIDIYSHPNFTNYTIPGPAVWSG